MANAAYPPVRGEFYYWATNRTPDPSEAMAIANRTIPDLQPHTSYVHDIRDQKSLYKLDQHGFQIMQSPSHNRIDESLLEDDAPSKWWPQVHDMVKQMLQARSVVAIHSVSRKSTPEQHVHPEAQGQQFAVKDQKPFHLVHNDYSAAGSRVLIRSMNPDFFEETRCDQATTLEERKQFWNLRKDIIAAEDSAIESSPATSYLNWDGSNYEGPRWAVLSIWKPLEKVQQDPLAIIDARSMFQGQSVRPYLPIPLRHRNRPGFIPDYTITNIMPLIPNEDRQYKWHWLSEQTPDEIYAIKLFDSEAMKAGSTLAPCAPHSAFTLDDENRLPRKSIETRVFVVW